MNKTIKKGMLAVGVAAGSALCGATLLAPSSFAEGAIGNPAFQDRNFYECVVKQYNAQNPGILETVTAETPLTDTQLASITALNCNFEEKKAEFVENLPSYYTATEAISNASGLEMLIGLKNLELAGHGNLTFDVAHNTRLKTLNANGNSLATLSLSGAPSINKLDVSDNKLVGLDVSKQTQLVVLDVSENQLAELDLEKNVELQKLSASGNGLTELNLEKNTALRTINIEDNEIEQLDLSKLPGVETLSADDILVTPYTQYSQTDNCELAAQLKFVGQANTIKSTEQYSFNNDAHILTLKSKPEDNIVKTVALQSSSSNSATTTGYDYRIDFGEKLDEEFEKLKTCVVKEPEVKVPDTGGSLAEEFDGKVIGASILGIATVAFLGFAGTYIYNRRKNHIKF